MSLHDWIHKYPHVQALLQQPEEELGYVVDEGIQEGNEDAEEWERIEQTLTAILGSTADNLPDDILDTGDPEAAPVEIVTPQAIYGYVEDVLRDNPRVTLEQMQSYLAQDNGLELPELAAYCPSLPEVYALYRRKWLLSFRRQLEMLQREGLGTEDHARRLRQGIEDLESSRGYAGGCNDAERSRP
jgi:hypothetical protein